ncbi:MAG: hypothetical protein U9Q95_04150 [Candidatus Eisenbacteria bacterium]|nr:hypothetical protein [Candidatus Eisenbacteria bacterium]
MRAESLRTGLQLALLTVLLLSASPGTLVGAMDSRTEEALLGIEAVLDMAEFSKDLWPAWDISETPFVVRCPDSTCYLINHPRPPVHFERVREESSLRVAVYRADTGDIPSGDDCFIEGISTAAVDLWGLTAELVPRAFEASFRAHGAELCQGSMQPIELLSGYPMDAWNLVLSDIECQLLHRAALAPADSLGVCVREFTSVRRHRRLRMGGRYAEFERRIEFTEGIPAYLAERCRGEAESYLGGRFARRLKDALGEAGALERSFPESPDLDWYRGERFRWTGAVLCGVMDRFDPDWKRTVSADCVDPFELMCVEVRGKTPSAKTVLARFGYEQLVASMTTTIERSKSDAERLFESIARSESPTFSIGTHLLSTGEISFDPSRIEKVDAHREVHTGILKIEYSGGTYLHVLGVPAAVVLGDDEFDLRKVMLVMPEEYTVMLDGEELETKEGVYEFTRSLSVVAEGISLEALAGMVMVGARGISFILHR